MQIKAIKEIYNTEIALIILCCREYINSSKNLLEEFILSNTIDWEKIYKLSQAHRLRPFIYMALLPYKNLIGAENLLTLRNFSIYFNAFALNNKRELTRILTVLEMNNILCKAFKGVDFAENIYGNIGLREFYDNDIIIKEEDINELIEVMTIEGYQSKDVRFYKKFSKEYTRDYKDVIFEKMNGNVREFAFEFHFKPARYYQLYPFSFEEIIGKNYLNKNKIYNEEDHLKLITINNGLMDLYPDIRSILDLAITLKKQNNTELKNIDPVLNSYLNYGQKISYELFQSPVTIVNINLNKNEIKFCNYLQNDILEMTQGKRKSILQHMRLNIKNTKSVMRKLKFAKNWLLLIIRPGMDDVNAIKFPNYFIYYFTKPFRLLFKTFTNLHFFK